jgi:CO dehydrogenase maturation factor
MRIAFLGKGGSGKTSLAAAYIDYLTRIRTIPHVVAVDGDVNVHLGAALGFSGHLKEAGNRFAEIARYFEQNRTALKGIGFDDVPLIGSIPPGEGSIFVTGRIDDPFYDRFADRNGPVTLLTIGSHTETDTGSSCYHNKLNASEMFFHHLIDGKDDHIVGDVTAGVDNLGTSLFMAYDLNIFVVEPTIKSVSVYRDYLELTKALPYQVETRVIVNKYHGPEDDAFIEQHIAGNRILGRIPVSSDLKKFERGDSSAARSFTDSLVPVFDAVYSYWLSRERNPDAYYAELVRLYRDRCYNWWNDFTGKPLDTVFESDATYFRSVIDSHKRS